MGLCDLPSQPRNDDALRCAHRDAGTFCPAQNRRRNDLQFVCELTVTLPHEVGQPGFPRCQRASYHTPYIPVGAVPTSAVSPVSLMGKPYTGRTVCRSLPNPGTVPSLAHLEPYPHPAPGPPTAPKGPPAQSTALVVLRIPAKPRRGKGSLSPGTPRSVSPALPKILENPKNEMEPLLPPSLAQLFMKKLSNIRYIRSWYH